MTYRIYKRLTMKICYLLLWLESHTLLIFAQNGIFRSYKTRSAMFLKQCDEGISTKPPFKIVTKTYFHECSSSCLNEDTCKCYNFKSTGNDNCELLNEKMNLKTESCIAKPGWKYYDGGKQEISAIKDDTGEYCLVPSTLNQKVVDTTKLVMKKNQSMCNEEYAKFYFKHETGDLVHFQSRKPVCTMTLEDNENVQINSNCLNAELQKRWTRTQTGALSYGDIFCIGPIAGEKSDNKELVIQKLNCNIESNKFKLYELDRANVLVSIWKHFDGWEINALTSRSDFPDSPTETIMYIDHMFSTPNIMDFYGLSMKAYFSPPKAGQYTFYLSCDNFCQLSFGNKNGPNSVIISPTTSYTYIYQWTVSSSQKSNIMSLDQNNLYYMEALLVARTGGDHVQVGMIIPGETSIVPITYRHLYPIK